MSSYLISVVGVFCVLARKKLSPGALTGHRLMRSWRYTQKMFYLERLFHELNALKFLAVSLKMTHVGITVSIFSLFIALVFSEWKTSSTICSQLLFCRLIGVIVYLLQLYYPRAWTLPGVLSVVQENDFCSVRKFERN